MSSAALGTIGGICFLIYVIFGWWAANRTIFWNTGLIGTFNWIFMVKFVTAAALGWCLIPIAIFLKATGRR